MHPFSPFCSPNFAHHFPAHPLENTVPYSLFICQCSGARLLRPSHTSGTKDPCRPVCAVLASALLEICTYRLYQSCSPHIRSRTPFCLSLLPVNVPAPVSSYRPTRPVQKICAAFLRAFPASVLLEIRTYRLYQSCSPHIRSRTPFCLSFYLSMSRRRLLL